MGRRGEPAEEETSEKRGGEEGGHTHLPNGFSEAVVVEEGRDVRGG